MHKISKVAIFLISFLFNEKTKVNLNYAILSFPHLFFYDKDYVGKTFVCFFTKCEFDSL